MSVAVAFLVTKMARTFVLPSACFNVVGAEVAAARYEEPSKVIRFGEGGVPPKPRRLFTSTVTWRLAEIRLS